jgi:hypothetical protein
LHSNPAVPLQYSNERLNLTTLMNGKNDYVSR